MRHLDLFRHPLHCHSGKIDLISRQSRIDLDRPLIDAAFHALRPGKTLLAEPVGDTQTAAAASLIVAITVSFKVL